MRRRAFSPPPSSQNKGRRIARRPFAACCFGPVRSPTTPHSTPCAHIMRVNGKRPAHAPSRFRGRGRRPCRASCLQSSSSMSRSSLFCSISLGDMKIVDEMAAGCARTHMGDRALQAKCAGRRLFRSKPLYSSAASVARSGAVSRSLSGARKAMRVRAPRYFTYSPATRRMTPGSVAHCATST